MSEAPERIWFHALSKKHFHINPPSDAVKYIRSERQNVFICQQCGAEHEHTLDSGIERLKSAIEKIRQWVKAYPVRVFPEPDFVKAAKVLKAAGMSLDAISASNMRHVITRVGEILEQALKEEDR